MMTFRSLAMVTVMLLSLTAAEDMFNGQCGNEINAFVTCVVSSGGITDGFEEGCQGCIVAASSAIDTSTDATTLSCDELVGVVMASIDSCAQDCAMEGCTTELRGVFTCLSILNSGCANNVSAPSASPSVASSSSSGAGFGAFMAVIEEIVPLMIAVLGGSGGAGR
jgi:hypothetical protein